MQTPAVTVEQSGEKQPQPRTEATREKEFNEAVDRIYRRYGTDLSAFTRDVQRELQKRAGQEIQHS